jgi:hypothetical protein
MRLSHGYYLVQSRHAIVLGGELWRELRGQLRGHPGDHGCGECGVRERRRGRGRGRRGGGGRRDGLRRRVAKGGGGQCEQFGRCGCAA